MSDFNLYKVNFNIDMVIAVEKDDLNPTPAFKEALEVHIDSVVENEINDSSLRFEKVQLLEDLPLGWWSSSPPYHKYKEEPDALCGYTVGDILESNRRDELAEESANKAMLLQRISKLEEEIAELKQSIK